MNKKRYIKPKTEFLVAEIQTILAGSVDKAQEEDYSKENVKQFLDDEGGVWGN